MTERDVHSPRDTGYRLGAENPEEAAEFAEVAAKLALDAEPVQPPDSLKAGILAKVATTPQFEPITDAAQTAAPDPFTAAGSTDTDPPLTRPQPPHVDPQQQPGPVETRARARWYGRPAVIIAAAAAAVVLFFGGVVVGTAVTHGSSSTSQQASALAQLNAAPDVQRARAQVAGGGTATLVWSGDLGKSAVVFTGVRALPSGKTYQLWYLKDGAAVSAGTVDVSGTGTTWQVLQGTMTVGDEVAMTVEPAGGSQQPTTRPVLSIQS